MAWGVTVFLLGILVGWANPGTPDRVELLRIGGLLAVPAAFGYTMLGLALGSDPLLLGTGVVAGIVMFLLLALLFLAGAWVGDALERRVRPSQRPRSRGNGAGSGPG